MDGATCYSVFGFLLICWRFINRIIKKRKITKQTKWTKECEWITRRKKVKVFDGLQMFEYIWMCTNIFNGTQKKKTQIFLFWLGLAHNKIWFVYYLMAP